MNNQENVDEQQVNEPKCQEYILPSSDEDMLKGVSGSGALYSKIRTLIRKPSSSSVQESYDSMKRLGYLAKAGKQTAEERRALQKMTPAGQPSELRRYDSAAPFLNQSPELRHSKSAKF